MSTDRQRLRPWLEERIDSGEVPGLCWLDKDRTKFRVTWKHAGKPDFDLERDAVLFRMWAEHTGKYKRGEQPDPSTWKTRFRCALHKMPDIEEIRVPHSLDEKEPYRVFRLKPKVPSSPKSKLRTSSSLSVNTPSPSPPNDYDTGFLYPGPFSGHNSFLHPNYGPMSYNPADICAFPSPISSHASSPPHCTDLSGTTTGTMYGSVEDDIDNITPTIPPIGLFGSNGHLDSGMDTLGMKGQPVPYGMNDDYFMKTNSFNNNNAHSFCYPMSSSESQGEPNLTELQSVKSETMIGYGGGGSGAGMYEAMPFSGMTSNMGNSGQSSIFTAQNGNSQLPGLLKMLHAGFPIEMVHEMNQLPQVSNGFSGNSIVDINTSSAYSTPKLNEIHPVSSYSVTNKVTLLELEKLATSRHLKDKTECLMSVRVFYEETEVMAFDLEKDERILRLYSGKPFKQESNASLGYYSQCKAKQMQLPDLPCSADVKYELANFSRGLVVEMSSDGNIWATRLCLSKVFYACQAKPATKLLQEVKTKVFEFTDEFQQTILEGKPENCVTSPYDITFFLGQQPSNASVSVVITHVQAKRCMTGKTSPQTRSAPEPIMGGR